MTAQLTGLILAGGQGARVGGQDKGLLQYQEKALVEWAIEALEPQVDQIIISANRNIERYETYGYSVVVDGISGFQGPLAGVSAALSVVSAGLMAIVPCDGVQFPGDFVFRLQQGLDADHRAEIAFVHDGDRNQYLYALMQASLGDSLEDYLQSGGRAVRRWYSTRRSIAVDFSGTASLFQNLNEL